MQEVERRRTPKPATAGMQEVERRRTPKPVGPHRHPEDPRSHRKPQCRRRLTPRPACAASFLRGRFALVPDASGRAVGRHRHEAVRSPRPIRRTFPVFSPEKRPPWQHRIPGDHRPSCREAHFSWPVVLRLSSLSFLSASSADSIVAVRNQPEIAVGARVSVSEVRATVPELPQRAF